MFRHFKEWWRLQSISLEDGLEIHLCFGKKWIPDTWMGELKWGLRVETSPNLLEEGIRRAV